LVDTSAGTLTSGTLNGIKIGSVTDPGVAVTSNALTIGGGWDKQISGNGWSVDGVGNLTVAGCTGCGSGATLQTDYSVSTGGSTSELIMDSTRGGLDIQDRSTTNGGTLNGNLLAVRATAANDTTQGAALFTVNSTGQILAQNSADSASAFKIQNSSGNQLLNINTLSNIVSVSDSNNNAVLNVNSLAVTNIITNPGFEANGNAATPTGWAKLQGAETTFLTDNGVTSHDGAENLKVVTAAATANQGAKYVYQFSANTTYVFSVWAAASAGFSTFDLGTSINSSTATCLSGQTLGTTMQQFNCTFTTGSTTTASDYVFARDSSSTSHTIYLDSASLTAANGGLVNLVGNPSFEQNNVNGWAAKGSTGPPTVAVSTDNANYGTASMKVTMGTANNQGAQYSVPLQPNTQYSLSMWIKKDTGSFALLDIGRNENGSDTNCLSSQTADTTWRQFTCTFTVGGTVGSSPTIYIRHGTDTTSETLYVDGVTLVQASSGLSFTAPASNLQIDAQLNNITLNGGASGEIQPWQSDTNTLSATRHAATVTANGYIYYIGGTASNGTSGAISSAVSYAKLNADGSPGSWATGNTLPVALYGASAVVANNFPVCNRWL
jgi:hypothetical protein